MELAGFTFPEVCTKPFLPPAGFVAVPAPCITKKNSTPSLRSPSLSSFSPMSSRSYASALIPLSAVRFILSRVLRTSLRQFGILPPKVVPVAKTKQTMPRKERKELKKQQAAGGNGFHTSARACFTAPELSFHGDGGGEPIDALSQVFAPGFEEAMNGPTSTQRQAPSADGLFESALLRNTRRLSLAWGTGRGGAAGAPHDGDGGNTIADRLSQMSLESGRELEQMTNSSAAAAEATVPDAPPSQPQRVTLSLLHTVLASHLALLGPTAARSMAMAGTWPTGSVGPGDAR